MTKMTGITIVGLGPGDPGLLTRQAWDLLDSIPEIYLRTRQHPSVEGFPGGLQIHSFDHLYEEEEDIERVYEGIVNRVVELGRRTEGVVYGVPGHPFVAEATCPEIYRRAMEEDIPIKVIDGISFIEPVLTILGVDPLPHTAIVDALELASAHHPPFPPSVPALIAQVYSKMVAGEVKITLMALYPDDHPVQLVHAAAMAEIKVEERCLHQIDQSEDIGLLTSLYVPPLGENTSFEDFQELIAHLRAPEGCPWDREQTHQTLRTNLMEEVYEALNAIDQDDPVKMQEEFGDLLLQIVLQAQIAAEYGEFTMSDVIQSIHAKLVRRHPHVFGDEDLRDTQGVIKNWERLKALEREENDLESNGLLDGISTAMPALAVADAYQRRAARVGFDWPEIEGVIDKVLEEIGEFQQAEGKEDQGEEIGDIFFALANLARWVGVDPEAALRETNAKFHQRFAVIEDETQKLGKQLSDMTLEEMDEIWERTKGKFK
ncbi:MAG: nucleoside triphosphate pyrophosphohydrolase [Anaerolineales bacterium]|nr:MAG: nucleoside triphosphate pyrophosphohydrolase [Anaerolineales bacterium]